MMDPKKPKIVFIHPDLGIGGAERLVLDIAVALSEKNDVSFVTNHFNKHHAFKELQDDQFPVRVIGSWIPRSICGIFQALFSYIRMIYLAIYYVFFINNSENPDLFFIDQIPMAVPFIKWAGGKVIYYCHHPDLLASSPGGFLKRLYRLPINWLELKGTAMSDIILVNSKYTATVFQKTFPQITKNLFIVYPTISSSYQELVTNNQHKDVNEISHISKETFVYLSINRFHPAKRLELALDAFEAAKMKLSSNEWSNVHIIVAGGYDPHSRINASYFTKLIKLCKDKDLTTKVTFLKSPSDSLKADLLLRCNCLVYTPINEHFGIVPLEAMAAGKPVIACNSGGPCETVLDGVTGYLCDPTGDALASAICKILRNSEASEMGLKGKSRLQDYFSYENFKTRVNEISTKTLRNENLAVETNCETQHSSNTLEHSLDLACDKSPQSKVGVKEVEHSSNSPVHSPNQAYDKSPQSKVGVEDVERSSNSPAHSPNQACGKSPQSKVCVEEVKTSTSSEKNAQVSNFEKNSLLGRDTQNESFSPKENGNTSLSERNSQGGTDLNSSTGSEPNTEAGVNKTFDIQDVGTGNVTIVVSPCSTVSSNDGEMLECGEQNAQNAF